jgi:diguanylate cyclase (GGDEF)-like protein
VDFVRSFELFASPHARVRVEPPDRVIVEVANLAPIVTPRGEILERAVRRQGDGIVVQLATTRGGPVVLGPFPHADGVALSHAIEAATRDVLFAVPGLSVTVSRDRASIVVAMSATVFSISATELVAIHVRTAPAPRARRVYPTGLPPTAEMRWVELQFVDGAASSFGPLHADHAAVIAHGFAAWRATVPIDTTPIAVDEAALAAEPARWHLRRITTLAAWHFGFEQSRVGPAWLAVPVHAPVSYGTYRARIVGTWVYPVANADGGYGHLGGSPGELRAESIDIVETLHRPDQGRDGLTGLLRRSSLQDALGPGAVVVAQCNLDRFKRVNDTHGHELGDEVLRRCARAITGTVRPTDVVARWSADQYTIVMPGLTLAAAQPLLEQVRAAIAGLGLSSPAGPVMLTASIGAVERASGEATGAVFVRADDAMIDAKRRGRDQLVVG